MELSRRSCIVRKGGFPLSEMIGEFVVAAKISSSGN